MSNSSKRKKLRRGSQGRGPHLLSIVDAEDEYDDDDDSTDPTTDIMSVEIVKAKLYN